MHYLPVGRRSTISQVNPRETITVRLFILWCISVWRKIHLFFSNLLYSKQITYLIKFFSCQFWRLRDGRVVNRLRIRWKNLYVHGKDAKIHKTEEISVNIFSVLCIFASSPCTHRFFQRILSRFCVPQAALNLPYSPFTLKNFPWIIWIRRRNEEYAEKKFQLQQAWDSILKNLMGD
jgi:hypothetical protein